MKTNVNIDREKVLVLNRNMQAIDTVSVRKAIKMMCDPIPEYPGFTAVAVNYLEEDGGYELLTFPEWVTKEPKEGELFFQTVKIRVRVPRVVIATRCVANPTREPPLTLIEVAKRDNFRDVVTGEYVPIEEGSMDHIEPRRIAPHRRKDWTNIGYRHRKGNNKKGDKTLAEMGEKLRKELKAPGKKPRGLFIDLVHEEWRPFLPQHQN